MTRRAVAATLAAFALAGCELQEITLAEPEDRVVAEALVQVRQGSDPATFDARIMVLLHRTLAATGEARGPVEGARVQVGLPGGQFVEVPADPVLGFCIAGRVPGATEGPPGTCHVTSVVGAIEPGMILTLTVELPGGGRLTGEARVPGLPELVVPSARGACRVEPSRPLELRWRPAEGAWAYIGETEIMGLAKALPDIAGDVADPFFLLGLAVGAEDTTMVYPGQFGVFERADLDRDLALELQKGLPRGTRAQVAVVAVDRNYVNWVRGGNFNPSGPVRVPSLRGDGTGFFGVSSGADFQVVSETASGSGLPACEGGRE